MRLFNVSQIDVRFSIHCGDVLFVDFTPPVGSNCMCATETLEVKDIPIDVAGYIEFMDGMAGR